MANTTAGKGADAKVECIIPILNVRNFSASIDYYVTVLGFRKEWDWGDPPDIGSVVRDNYSIMLCEPATESPLVRYAKNLGARIVEDQTQ